MQERFPQVQIITGSRGVGKSYLTNKRIQEYIKNNPRTGKPGEKVLVYNTNVEASYPYPSIDADPFHYKKRRSFPTHIKLPKTGKKIPVKNKDELYEITRQARKIYIRNLKTAAIRTLIPLWKGGANGIKMTGEEKKDLLKDALNSFTAGLIVLEDLDKFNVRGGNTDADLIDMLSTGRHTSVDAWIVHQSISKTTPSEIENSVTLRMHNESSDLQSFIDQRRWQNKELIKVSDLILKHNYSKATALYKKGQLGLKDYHEYKSLAIVINFDDNTLAGCSPEQFQWGCMMYLKKNPSIIKSKMKETGWDGKQKYDYQSAFVAKIRELQAHYVGG